MLAVLDLLRQTETVNEEDLLLQPYKMANRVKNTQLLTQQIPYVQDGCGSQSCLGPSVFKALELHNLRRVGGSE